MTASRTRRTTLATTSPTSHKPVANSKHPLLSGSSSSPLPLGAFSDADTPIKAANKDSRLNDDQTKDGGSNKDANLTNEESSSMGGGSVFGPPDCANLILHDHRLPHLYPHDCQRRSKGALRMRTAHPHLPTPCASPCLGMLSPCQKMIVPADHSLIMFRTMGRAACSTLLAKSSPLWQKELHKMTNWVGGIRDDGNTGKETYLYACGVHFGETTTLEGNLRHTSPSPCPNPDHGLTTESLHEAFEEATQMPRKVCVDPLPLWYGFEDFAGKGWVFADATKIKKCLSLGVIPQIDGIFHSKGGADKWK
jgi:hypothetical protein